MYILCLRLMNDTQLAEKLTIETFLTTWRNIPFLREDTLFSSWLTGITTYTILGWIRNNGGKWDELEHSKLKQSKAELNKKDINPFDINIFTLPDTERFVFVLHDLEKYSSEEVADLLAISSDAVDGILKKAYDKLIPEDYPGDGNSYIENYINSVSQVIQPENDLWKFIFSELSNLESESKKSSAQIAEPNDVEQSGKKGKKFGFLGWKKK